MLLQAASATWLSCLSIFHEVQIDISWLWDLIFPQITEPKVCFLAKSAFEGTMDCSCWDADVWLDNNTCKSSQQKYDELFHNKA